MKKHDFIPYGCQSINEKDLASVCSTLKSSWLTQGPKVKEFEQQIAKKVGAKFAVACSNGTAALHLACLASGFVEGDTVLTSPMTFLASANCVRYVGADVDFIDVKAGTNCIDPDLIEAYLTKNINEKNLKGIIPVHFAGIPCEMAEICDLAKKHKMVVIEDACHALGAYYKYGGEDVLIGSCRHSDMTVFSFHPVKHITTGEGGMITTNSRELYDKLMLFRSHGVTKEPEMFVNRDAAFDSFVSSGVESPNPWYYEMHSLGYNYRITDMQCALGLSQLEQLDSFMSSRDELVDRYVSAFKDNEYIKILEPEKDQFPSWHLFPVQFDINKLKLSRYEIVKEYQENNIGVQIHYIPLHYQPYYSKLYKLNKGDYPNAEKYYDRCVSLPLFPKLSEDDINYVIDVTFQIIKKGQ